VMADRHFQVGATLTLCFSGSAEATSLLAPVRVVRVEALSGGGWFLGCPFAAELGVSAFGEVLEADVGRRRRRLIKHPTGAMVGRYKRFSTSLTRIEPFVLERLRGLAAESAAVPADVAAALTARSPQQQARYLRALVASVDYDGE